MRIEVSSRLALPSGESGSGIGFVPRNMALTFDPSDIGARPVQIDVTSDDSVQAAAALLVALSVRGRR